MLLFSRGSNPSVNTLLLRLFLSCPLWITSSCKKKYSTGRCCSGYYWLEHAGRRPAQSSSCLPGFAHQLYATLLLCTYLPWNRPCFFVPRFFSGSERLRRDPHLSHRCSFSKSVRNSSNLKRMTGGNNLFLTTPFQVGTKTCVSQISLSRNLQNKKKRTILNIYINRK